MVHDWSGERLETFVHNETTVEHLHRYAFAMEYVNGKKVLDIACGEGYGSSLLSHSALHVTGIDIDKQTITKAKDKYRKPNLDFIQGDVRQIPMPTSSVDFVTSFETLEHIAEHEQMLHEIKRVLKPGGILLLSTPDKKLHSDLNPIKSKFHLKELYKREFEQLMAAHFKYVHYFHQRSFFSSAILPTILSDHWPVFYEGNFEAVSKVETLEPYFILSIASDVSIEIASAPSFFKGDSIFNAAIKNAQDAVLNSVTYKAGRLILAPFKFFKNVFLPKESR